MAIKSGTRNGKPWRLSSSQCTLYDQINALAPNRSKTVGPDGSIGDAAHASRTSDHNPNAQGVVTALDISHDPQGGCDARALCETIRQHKDERTKYCISNEEIFYGPRSPTYGNDPNKLWTWRPYSGDNPHDKHCHISVGNPAFYDRTDPWVLDGWSTTPAPPSGRPTLSLGSRGPYVDQVQTTLAIPNDGSFGPVTEAAVEGFQAAHELAVDGVVGPITWEALDALDARVAAGDDGLPDDLVVEIARLAASSSLLTHQWRDRGMSPPGFIAGMAVTYGLAVKWLGEGAQAAETMAAARGSADVDALAYLADQFKAVGWDTSKPGGDTLRSLFAMMFGLGMRESSGRYCEGRDRSASNTSADTCESGVFQTSANIRTADVSIDRIHEAYWRSPCGFESVFDDGVMPTANDLGVYGRGTGAQMQWLWKFAPASTVMISAIGLRKRRSHWGPVNRKEVEFVPACDELLRQVDVLMAKPFHPIEEPTPTPGEPAVITVKIDPPGSARVEVIGEAE